MGINGKRVFVIIMCALFAAAAFTGLQAATVGQVLTDVQVKDSNNNPSAITDFGKKVIIIFYVDPDKDQLNTPLQDAVDKKKYPDAKFNGVGIVNLKDTWLPNSAIRFMIRREEKKYNTKILTDPARIIPGAWGLGDCNDTGVVLVIGKDKKLHYIFKGGARGPEIDKVLKLIEGLIGK